MESYKKMLHVAKRAYTFRFMLQAIRNRQKILLTIFVTLISIVFVFWGFFGNFGSQTLSKNAVASVNGDAISVQEFQNQYQNTVRLYQNLLKDQFTPEMAERFNLKRMTLNQLIDQKIITQGAESLGLKVTDEEVKDTIVQTTVFHRNNQFDKEYYKLLLKNNRLTPQHYEEAVSLELLQRKVRELLRQHIQISEEEIKAQYLLQNDKVNLSFIRVDAKDFESKIQLTDLDIETYLKVPKNVEAAKADYEENGAQYKVENQVRARHILIKGKTDEARKKIEEIQAKTTAQNFEQMAKEHSQDGSAAQGGDLGFFGKGKMVKAFEDVAFKLKPGEVSDSVESPFGYHLIKVEEVQTERQKPFEEVQNDIARRLLAQEKAKALAKDLSNQIWDSKNSDRKLKNLLKAQGLQWEETGVFNRGAVSIPKIGNAKDMKATAFSKLKEGAWANQKFEIQDRIFLVKIKKREPADLKKLATDKDKLKEQYLSQKQSDAFFGWIQDLKDKSKIVVRKATLDEL